MGTPRVLVVGTGFAGYHCLRALERALPPDAADLVAVNPTDYMLYVPLLPEVAGGSLDPRRVAVPLRPTLPRTRQGKLAGRNVAASLGFGTAGRYRHRDLGFVVDLGGGQAVADPLHVPLTGLPAKAVAKGYHLIAMPGNRLRVAVDWLTDLPGRRQVGRFGLVPEAGVRLGDAERVPSPSP
ncbi:hypothetical protein CKY47_09325 [Saccharothrix yanglingensis]|uniref:FAD/NAD(P)-binding domain-containing protein n=1 Tax=Saccharothrix yanglingensis TaxID=659496 RepID=A0ABU0WXD9_9PSEU|nr:hypothetical protein [Saccharothrix yanglingensis]